MNMSLQIVKENQNEGKVEKEKKGLNGKLVAIFGGCSLALCAIVLVVMFIVQRSGEKATNSLQNEPIGSKPAGVKENTTSKPKTRKPKSKEADGDELANNSQSDDPTSKPRTPQQDSTVKNESKEGRKTGAESTAATKSPKPKNVFIAKLENSRPDLVKPNKADAQPDKTTVPKAFPYSEDHRSPIPDAVKALSKNLVLNVDDAKAFTDCLDDLRSKVALPSGMVGIEADTYVDSMVEKHLGEELKKVIFSDLSKDAIKGALEDYHKVVEKTKAVVHLPKDIKDIKDVEMCRIAWKCIKGGKLDADDKIQLQDILLSPSRSYTIGQDACAFLGRKLAGSTEDEAAATIKTFFTGNEELKETFREYTMFADKLLLRFDFDENRGQLLAQFPHFTKCINKLPSELKDEVFYRGDVKALQGLLESLNRPSSDLLEKIKRKEIPSMGDIIITVETTLPKDDPLFMAKFARLMFAYTSDLGYEQLQVNPQKREEIKQAVDYCRFILIPKYVELLAYVPQDPRITGLSEWNEYVKDPSNITKVGMLFRAISNLGINTDCVVEYASKSALLCKGTVFQETILLLLRLFQFSFPQDHPYNAMKEGLFDFSNADCRSAKKTFLDKSDMTSQEQFLSRCLREYSPNCDGRNGRLLKDSLLVGTKSTNRGCPKSIIRHYPPPRLQLYLQLDLIELLI